MEQQLSYAQIQKQLVQKQYHPIYFLQGEETYFIDEIVGHLTHHVLPRGVQDFNFKIYYGQEISLSTILQQAKAFPMLGDLQIILVKDAEKLYELQKETSSSELTNYLIQPNKASILIFVHKKKKLDARKKLTKALLTHSCFFTSNPLHERQIPIWISKFVTSKNYQITEKANFILQTLVGSQLTLLAKELEKVMQNLPKGKVIGEEDIRTYIAHSKQYSVFDLQEALLTGDPSKLHALATYLAQDEKNNPLPKVIAFLTTLFTRLLQLQVPNTAKLPLLHPYVHKIYNQALPLFPLVRILKILNVLHEADKQIKGIDHPILSHAYIVKNLMTKIIASQSI